MEKASPASMLTQDQLANMDDDEFFKAYAEGRVQRRADAWTEANWEQQMESTPLFMTKEPTPDQIQQSPELSALQSIVDEYAPHERAAYSKEHGNVAFLKGKNAKEKKFKLAELRRSILLYSEGLAANCDSAELNSTLLSNRAAANLLLENYRQATIDCERAISLVPTNAKAHYRGASACLTLEKFEDAINWCDRGLLNIPSCEELIQLRAQVVEKKAAVEKQKRKDARAERQKVDAFNALSDTITQRGVRLVDEMRRPVTLKSPSFVHAVLPGDPKVSIDKDGVIRWPVVFQYPEYQKLDVVAEFRENSSFAEELEAMFPDNGERVEWDKNHTYRASKLAVYFSAFNESGKKQTLFEINRESTLGEALRHPSYVVLGASPCFIVVVSGSTFETELFKLFKFEKK